MEVVHGLGDGAQDVTGFALREVSLPEDAVQELPTTHQLHYQVHKLAIIIDLRSGEGAHRGLRDAHVTTAGCCERATTPEGTGEGSQRGEAGTTGSYGSANKASAG